MASVSTKQIKNRIRSMRSTRQITKAMEMVAASKLRHAQTKAENARPYFESLRDIVADIAGFDTDLPSVYQTGREVKKSLYIVIAGDRGLAGGYNSNIWKLARSEMEGKQPRVLPVGKKSVDYFKAHGVLVLTEEYAQADEMSIGDCLRMGKQLARGYQQREFDEIVLIYTNFISALSQAPQIQRLLPLSPAPGQRTQLLYEPDSAAALERIIPEYLGGMLYGALCQSQASEQAARRTAMNAATQNADEIIKDLSLRFNQARQAAITQEITEIVAGS